PSGETCGSGGVHNVCAEGPDGCTMMTCASQNITCGHAGDGCGGTLDCGTCNFPQTCGGDPTKPGQCGRAGECSMLPTCPPGMTTTLTGTAATALLDRSAAPVGRGSARRLSDSRRVATHVTRRCGPRRRSRATNVACGRHQPEHACLWFH